MASVNTLRGIVLAILMPLLAVSALSCFKLASGSPANWSEVTRFTGTDTGGSVQNTTDFTCSHVEWRIRWSYTPGSLYPSGATLTGLAFPKGSAIPVAAPAIGNTGASNTSGTVYVHNDPGTFHIQYLASLTQSYTLIIEQDLDSIPEAPPFLIVPLFMMATLLAAVVLQKKRYS